MTEAIQDGVVRGFIHSAASNDISMVLAHGAGSDCKSRLLVAVSEALANAGISTLRIDLPFRQLRPKGPPHPSSAANDREGIRAAIEWMRRQGYGAIAIGGHSYGGRQASMLAAEDRQISAALLLLSYPLHPPGRTEQKRTAHWPALQIPALFVHGTRDPFGSPEELRIATADLGGRSELFLVEGAGHELKPVLHRPTILVDTWLGFIEGTRAAVNPSNC